MSPGPGKHPESQKLNPERKELIQRYMTGASDVDPPDAAPTDEPRPAAEPAPASPAPAAPVPAHVAPARVASAPPVQAPADAAAAAAAELYLTSEAVRRELAVIRSSAKEIGEQRRAGGAVRFPRVSAPRFAGMASRRPNRSTVVWYLLTVTVAVVVAASISRILS